MVAVTLVFGENQWFFGAKKRFFPEEIDSSVHFFAFKGSISLYFYVILKKPSRFFLSEEKRDLFDNSRARENSLAQT